MNTFELDQNYIANTYARFPLEIVFGKGSLLTDRNGKEYIDLGTGIAVNTFGTADPEWVAAVTAQLQRFSHTSNLFYAEPCAKLAQELCTRTGMKKVFFSNSGAEANECAIKAARAYGEKTKGAGHSTIVTLKNSFHGRTLTTLAATGQDTFHRAFQPLTPGFVYAEANNPDDLRCLVRQTPCTAILFEMVQGEGGVLPLTEAFCKAMQEIAKEENLLLIADEVQTGNGRSGSLYAYMNYGLKPDIVTTAKGLAGGLPLGATLLGEKVQDIFAPGDNGSTFGGNAAACAGALNILSRLDDAMLEGVKKRSQMIFQMLEGKPGIRSVTGMGLMIGVETSGDAGEILAQCREKGVIALKAKQKIRLLPPLNIPIDLLEKALNILIEVCGEKEKTK